MTPRSHTEYRITERLIKYVYVHSLKEATSFKFTHMQRCFFVRLVTCEIIQSDYIYHIGRSKSVHLFVCVRRVNNNNRLLTEREGRTGEYWPEVVAVRTEQFSNAYGR